ncbi:hypothetical protein DFH08DRAFT_807217 [Mycena albidolilacea]|uniref:Tat pathway signal sequence n=1 Tax=Mycena albidolilacea TaxID=1033008 RepID=A0AAD7A5K5_9AGAR|nr:hypothetical protein DFH08DRAFT_807217 [Mycena albidolilacea]
MTGAYHILPTDDIDSDDKHSQPHPSHSRFSRTVVVLLAIVLVETAAFATHVLYSRKPTSSATKLYSPAQDVVEDIVQFYAGGFGDDKTSFQIPSSPGLDGAWDALYQHGISRIPKSVAAQIPNTTSPIPGDPGFYIAELDVYHELHCLNTIRKALDPVYYPEWDITKVQYARDHISHCVEWIRSSIMCHSDISVVVWQWDAQANYTVPKTNVPHTCRNFDAIQEWARENSLEGDFDFTVHVEDNLEVYQEKWR